MSGKPAPKQAQPIKGPGDHAGQLRVIIAFRMDRSPMPADIWRQRIRTMILGWARNIRPEIHDLDVAATVIGAGGEKSEMEGEGP